ncbi:Crp/Fnr family transcriptional regulator [Acuticoccus mangrovi]|uniref:Crp/Fnr family transcriptional regulator n=1 Tax=Acuticoccus mangrovi TaxID=2796142 RepID=A0A934MIS3_9HYPH|nr:Crp/Fnr family transcriptional regulator [Acuticoccus mangrovi]MBJ3777491.1 Crp/Fnr family transcriptional regulator [Acuticoccus mangrovi]
MSPDELWELNSAARHKTYPAGQTIVTQGEPNVLANIVTGIVVEKKGLADGREQIVSLLFPSDFLGNAYRRDADATAQTVSPVTLCTFERSGFEDVVRSHSAFRQALFDHAVAELDQAREWMLLLGQMRAGERVATFLMRLARRQSDAGCSHMPRDVVSDGAMLRIPITRGQMAAFLGLTVETVSRKLGALRDAGVIDLLGPRTVRINNVERLLAESL